MALISAEKNSTYSMKKKQKKGKIHTTNGKCDIRWQK